jgi:hypothetical protein
MTAQPQPPQQPIFPNELNLALDRNYTRIVGYVDARIDALSTQMRVNNQESIQRDQDLANVLIAFRDESRKQLEALREENKKQIESILQLVKELHAEAMEGINELRQKGKE